MAKKIYNLKSFNKTQVTISSYALFGSPLPFAKFDGISHKCPALSNLNVLYPINVSPIFRVSSQLIFIKTPVGPQ